MRRFLVLGLVMAVGLSAASLAAASASRGSSAPGHSLLANGSFESGTSGFTTQYSTTEGLGPAQTVGVGTNPSAFNGPWQPFADHTTGHGSMLAGQRKQHPEPVRLVGDGRRRRRGHLHLDGLGGEPVHGPGPAPVRR